MSLHQCSNCKSISEARILIEFEKKTQWTNTYKERAKKFKEQNKIKNEFEQQCKTHNKKLFSSPWCIYIHPHKIEIFDIDNEEIIDTKEYDFNLMNEPIFTYIECPICKYKHFVKTY